MTDLELLELAANTRLDILWCEHEPSVVVNNDSWAPENGCLVEVKASYSACTKTEALRRAITRVAAEIGKGMTP